MKQSDNPTTSDSEAELPSIHANEVKGTYCPSCGHPTLMLLNGYITCTLADCPNPDYVEVMEARLAQAEIKGQIHGHQNLVQILRFVINDDEPKRHAKHWIKQTEKLISDFEAQLKATEEGE